MTTIGEKVIDWYTQGIQISNCYKSDWNEIKSHFSRFGVNLNQHGPVITMNEVKYVREAARITENISNTNEYIELTGINDTRKRAGKIFLFNMYTLPYFSRLVSLPMYEAWIERPDKYIEKIYELDGTMKQRDQSIEEIVRNAIIFLRKK